MKLTKEQQKELKKIETSYSQIDRLSIKNDLNLKTVFRNIFPFKGVDLTDKDRQRVFNQNLSRQEVFEQAKTSKKKIKVTVSR